MSYVAFRKIIQKWKGRHSQRMDDETILEAFVACGGSPDGDGMIESRRLVEILKRFEMTIGIDKLLKEIDCKATGLIDYYDFKLLILRA